MLNRIALRRAALDLAGMAGGGILGTEQSKIFVEAMFDSSAFMQKVRREPMASATKEIDKIGMTSRIARRATENDATIVNYTQVPTFGKINLTAKKYMLPWEITDEVLEDNIEGDALETRIARLMATQFGNDVLDLAINGDDTVGAATTVAVEVDNVTDPIDITVASVTGFPRTGTAGYLLIGTEKLIYEYVDTVANKFLGCSRAEDGTTIATHLVGAAVTWVTHPLIGNDDGWLVKMYAGSNYVDLSAINSGDIAKEHFSALLRNLSPKYRAADLVWMMNPVQAEFWRDYVSNRATAAGDLVLLQGDKADRPRGYAIEEIAFMPEDMIALGRPKNLIIGVHREVKIEKAARDRDSIMRQTSSFAGSIRCDFEIEEADAIAFGDGLNAD